MPDLQLKTAVLGLDDAGKSLLDAAARLPYFHIVAVADTDAKLAEQTAGRYNCTGYDDYRQLIISNQLDCLLVAAPIHTCAEYIKQAIKKKFNIFKLPPLARDFAEAAQLVRLAEEHGVKFAVANTNRFTQSFIDLKETLSQNDFDPGGPGLINAFCGPRDLPPQPREIGAQSSGGPPPIESGSRDGEAGWQTDPKLAGGGVLINNAYQLIDTIICNFGLPGLVYSLNSNCAADKQQRSLLTEDTAILTMKFSDTLLGNLTASRISAGNPDLSGTLTFYGKDRIVTASACRLTVSDGLGRLVRDSEYNYDKLQCLTKQLENFGLHLLKPDKNPLISSAKENLKNMAVIEAAYLSARTSMPEQPPRILPPQPRYIGAQSSGGSGVF